VRCVLLSETENIDREKGGVEETAGEEEKQEESVAAEEEKGAGSEQREQAAAEAGSGEKAEAEAEKGGEGEGKKEEGAAAEEEKKEEEKPKFKLERDYVVPLQRVYWLGRNKRAKRAVRVLREFVLKHTKAERVVLDNEVNEAIWARSIKRPPRRLAVHVGVTEDKKAYVYLKKSSSA